MSPSRRYPIGAEPTSNGVHFRVWAPDRSDVAIVVEGGVTQRLKAEGNGYFSGHAAGVASGAFYRIQLDQGEAFPDPASRFQPDGPFGPSQVVDAQQFAWTDADWSGHDLAGLVIYELHVGTFTPEGNWNAATRELRELADIGINCIEVMPVADFAGNFGWGYDGVNLFAPTRLYGTPDEFRQFVDTAHQLKISVLLDVVYNHIGPAGNYLGQFAKSYFTDRYATDWGAALNFDGPDSSPVREYFLTNAAYWIDEFHLDGLRLDATQNIYDDAPPFAHILTEIAETVRTAAQGRKVVLINENEPQCSELCRSVKAGGYGLDGLWNDDFHHTAMVALTGHNEAYYTDYRGTPQEFISAAKYGYLYQGQWYSWQKKGRGTPGFDLPPATYVNYLQNHDQIANSGRGLRVHQLSCPGRYRALMAVTLLSPGTPMLFQGQEFAASSPFFFFADHDAELAQMVAAGRVEFLTQFRSLKDSGMAPIFAVPDDPQTFTRSKLDLSERHSHAAEYQLTKDLLKLRRTDAAFRAQRPHGVDGAVLGTNAFVLRFFETDGQDRLLVVNLGRDLHLRTLPEPLLAPPAGTQWHTVLSTEAPQYNGHGVAPLITEDDGWQIPGESATVLGWTEFPQPIGERSILKIPQFPRINR
ncbi:MAG: malto-oligosyltrehalose trehalohydrolase [Planctomycetota bacterium]